MVSAPVVLTEPAAAAAESPAAEPPEPQPEVVAQSGKSVDAPRLERGKWANTAVKPFSPCCRRFISHTFFSLQLLSPHVC